MIAVRDYLAKRGGARVNRERWSKAPADPDPAGYFHNTCSQSGTFYGWDGAFNVWDPAINIPNGGNDDHSILQVWLQNYDKGTQSLEGGWTVDKLLNGDALPHIFVYYTTNDYTVDGDYKGGYNSVYKGWVQYSGPSTTGRTVYPGIGITAVSVLDGPQYDVEMKFQLYQEPGSGLFNWWVRAEDVWIGYYPATLFGGLGKLVEWIGVGGEVYSDLKDPETTQDQMGSGLQAAAGWGKAAYLRNLRNQSDIGGTMVDNKGFATSDAATAGGADPYTILMDAEGPAGWGSYCYVGGPTPDASNLVAWRTNDRPLPKGVWDGENWSEAQHSRASNDKILDPPSVDSSVLRFVVSGTTDNVDAISFNIAIDRPGGDLTCWKGLGNGSVEGLGPVIQQHNLTLAKANERGFYVCEVKGATQPFTVTAQTAQIAD